MKQRDYDDLQELKEQAKDNLSFGAYQAYINGLEYHLEESRMLNIRLRNGIDAALCAYDLAGKEMEGIDEEPMFTDREKEAFKEPVVKEDTEKKVTCDRCGKCVDVWDIVEIGSKEYCGACEKLYDKDREAFEKPVVKEVTEPAWEAIRQFINETNNPLFHDFARAITWLKQRADDERSRIILLGERLDHIKEQLSGGDMK